MLAYKDFFAIVFLLHFGIQALPLGILFLASFGVFFKRGQLPDSINRLFIGIVIGC